MASSVVLVYITELTVPQEDAVEKAYKTYINGHSKAEECPLIFYLTESTC